MLACSWLRHHTRAAGCVNSLRAGAGTSRAMLRRSSDRATGRRRACSSPTTTPRPARACGSHSRPAGFEVCAEAADGEQAIALARKEKPDVCLLDISMPGGGESRRPPRSARRCRNGGRDAHGVRGRRRAVRLAQGGRRGLPAEGDRSQTGDAVRSCAASSTAHARCSRRPRRARSTSAAAGRSAARPTVARPACPRRGRHATGRARPTSRLTPVRTSSTSVHVAIVAAGPAARPAASESRGLAPGASRSW